MSLQPSQQPPMIKELESDLYDYHTYYTQKAHRLYIGNIISTVLLALIHILNAILVLITTFFDDLLSVKIAVIIMLMLLPIWIIIIHVLAVPLKVQKYKNISQSCLTDYYKIKGQTNPTEEFVTMIANNLIKYAAGEMPVVGTISLTQQQQSFIGYPQSSQQSQKSSQSSQPGSTAGSTIKVEIPHDEFINNTLATPDVSESSSDVTDTDINADRRLSYELNRLNSVEP